MRAGLLGWIGQGLRIGVTGGGEGGEQGGIHVAQEPSTGPALALWAVRQGLRWRWEESESPDCTESTLMNLCRTSVTFTRGAAAGISSASMVIPSRVISGGKGGGGSRHSPSSPSCSRGRGRPAALSCGAGGARAAALIAACCSQGKLHSLQGMRLCRSAPSQPKHARHTSERASNQP